MEIASREEFWLGFFSPSKAAKLCFLETCKSLLVFRKER